MKNFKFLFVSLFFVIFLSSCTATFNAPEILENDENRNELYRSIVSDQNKFSELLDVAASNEAAKKTLIQNHMQMMDSGNMKVMMEKNPEMKEKMMSHMEKMMNDPEMKEKMQKMMQDNPEMKKGMMHELEHKMETDQEFRNKMMDGMMKKMKEDPELMKKMMDKMHDDPEMMEKMKQHMEKSKKENKEHKDHNPLP
ncbi:hypothetical protein [Gramella sp. AN32]|uniref:Membrane or secreted protein n=1 Tax=Christiangramia antarctica TaxID=2058158 RepID=A0ABW5X3Q8_9FLAO|nr:hypothetical protein [Gramella sp. AN32]MCM4156626.1 hypothetical protein [Gramella sp. AN32]